MQLSTKGRYAVMAMVDLATGEAASGPDCLISLGEIAARQQLSLAYLEQLFSKLRRAGLVHATRGPGGGYRLARRAGEISVAAVVAAVDEPISATRCDKNDGGCMVGAAPDGCNQMCQTHDLWNELGRQIVVFLESVTLADVVEGRVAGRAMVAPVDVRAAG